MCIDSVLRWSLDCFSSMASLSIRIDQKTHKQDCLTLDKASANLEALSFLYLLATLARQLQYIQLNGSSKACFKASVLRWPVFCLWSVSWDERSESWGRGSWRKREPRDLRHPERRPANRFQHHAPPDRLLRTDTARIAPDMMESTRPF